MNFLEDEGLRRSCWWGTEVEGNARKSVDKGSLELNYFVNI